MKHDITAPDGIVFVEDEYVTDGLFVLVRQGHALLAGVLAGPNKKLSATYRMGDSVRISPKDFAAIQAGTPVTDESPWQTVMSAPDNIVLECRNNDGPKRLLKKQGGQWYGIFSSFSTYPPTHWRYPKE